MSSNDYHQYLSESLSEFTGLEPEGRQVVLSNVIVTRAAIDGYLKGRIDLQTGKPVDFNYMLDAIGSTAAAMRVMHMPLHNYIDNFLHDLGETGGINQRAKDAIIKGKLTDFSKDLKDIENQLRGVNGDAPGGDVGGMSKLFYAEMRGYLGDRKRNDILKMPEEEKKTLLKRAGQYMEHRSPTQQAELYADARFGDHDKKSNMFEMQLMIAGLALGITGPGIIPLVGLGLAGGVALHVLNDSLQELDNIIRNNTDKGRDGPEIDGKGGQGGKGGLGGR